MYVQVEKTKESKSRSVGNLIFQNKSSVKQGYRYVDNKAEAITSINLQNLGNNNVQNNKLRSIQEMKNNLVGNSLIPQDQTHTQKYKRNSNLTNGTMQLKSNTEIKNDFMKKYNEGKKTEAVNILKQQYHLNGHDYDLSVEILKKASTHASTGGGWTRDDSTKKAITVKVNEPYLDKQVKTDEGYNKLLHTLGHEYQHVKQRSKKGWRTTDDDSAKGEREFEAYSYEVLDAKLENSIPELYDDKKLSTIKKAKKNYNKMSNLKQNEHKERYESLIFIEDKIKQSKDQHEKDKIGGLVLIPGENVKDIQIPEPNKRTGVIKEVNLSANN